MASKSSTTSPPFWFQPSRFSKLSVDHVEKPWKFGIQSAGHRRLGLYRHPRDPTALEKWLQRSGDCPRSEQRQENPSVDRIVSTGARESGIGASRFASVRLLDKRRGYVIHVASPFPSVEPSDPNEIIRPAVEGTLAVLRAAHGSNTVKRVVLTSSAVAILGEGSPNGEPLTEENWTKADADVSTYYRSKTLAEKAAWDFVKEHPSLELTVINPGLVIGPMLHKSECTSGEVIIRMLQFQMPMIPDLWHTGVDVRDVAEAHVKAMTLPEAAGQRFGLGTRLVSWVEIAQILKEEFGPQGYWISTMRAPYWGVWIYSFVDKGAKMMLRDIGRKYNLDGTKMRKVLGIEPIDLRKSVLDTAYSVIEKGFVKKTDGYLERGFVRKIHGKGGPEGNN